MLSALDLARRIGAGEISPRDVVDMCARAIGEREQSVQAFTAHDLTMGRTRASAAECARMPLCGLPVGVKDIFDTHDFPTEYGSPIYAGHRPKADAAIV